MCDRQLLEKATAARRDLEKHLAPIALAGLLFHQAIFDAAIHELDGAVMLNPKTLRDAADGRLLASRKPLDREYQLMLLRLETERARARFAEVDEAANPITDFCQCPVLGRGDGFRHSAYISPHDIFANGGILPPISPRRPISPRSEMWCKTVCVSYEMLVLGASDVRELYDWDIAIESQRQAFAELGRGAACLPEKIILPAGENMALCYAARMSDDTGPVSKFISVHPKNGAKGLPSVQSVVTVLDPVDGRPVALIDGNEVTTRRTAAASALVISLLKTEPARVLTVLGSGVQGVAHVQAITRVHRFEQVRLWSPTRANRERAAAALRAELDLDVVAIDDAESAVTGASVIATCTSSEEPVLRGAWLSPGATVLSVGSFTETRSEIDAATMQRAGLVAVDHVPTEIAHGGPIVIALKRGDCKPEDLIPISDIVLGRHPGRSHRDEIIVYNSVGVGVQDAAAAWALIDRARTLGRGTRIAL